jgi:hypothetical protein
MNTLVKIVSKMHQLLIPAMGIAFVSFAAAAHADDLTVTRNLTDVAACTVVGQVQSQGYLWSYNHAIKQMTAQSLALHANTLLVLKPPLITNSIQGVAYQCAK